MAQISERVFKIVKDNIRVTWEYDDEIIEQSIREGISKIENICGRCDFDENATAQKLLKEYVRYDWNGASLYFEPNFKRELLQLQLSNAMEV